MLKNQRAKLCLTEKGKKNLRQNLLANGNFHLKKGKTKDFYAVSLFSDHSLKTGSHKLFVIEYPLVIQKSKVGVRRKVRQTTSAVSHRTVI